MSIFGGFRKTTRAFNSNEDLFRTVRELIAELRSAGQDGAADELERGMSCLNGLTDGWALFLDGIEVVRTRCAGK